MNWKIWKIKNGFSISPELVRTLAEADEIRIRAKADVEKTHRQGRIEAKRWGHELWKDKWQQRIQGLKSLLWGWRDPAYMQKKHDIKIYNRREKRWEKRLRRRAKRIESARIRRLVRQGDLVMRANHPILAAFVVLISAATILLAFMWAKAAGLALIALVPLLYWNMKAVPKVVEYYERRGDASKKEVEAMEKSRRRWKIAGLIVALAALAALTLLALNDQKYGLASFSAWTAVLGGRILANLGQKTTWKKILMPYSSTLVLGAALIYIFAPEQASPVPAPADNIVSARKATTQAAKQEVRNKQENEQGEK